MGQPVVHFEVVGNDGARLQGYYAELFGWKMDADNPMNYALVEAEKSSTGMSTPAASATARRATAATLPSTSKSPTSRRACRRPSVSAAPG